MEVIDWARRAEMLGSLDLGQVQASEIEVKAQGVVMWMGAAIWLECVGYNHRIDWALGMNFQNRVKRW